MSMAEQPSKRKGNTAIENGQPTGTSSTQRELDPTSSDPDQPASSNEDGSDSGDDDNEVEDASASAENQNNVNEGDEESEDEEEDNQEPTLKYTKLTSKLSTIYRNGDSTSSSLVSGDKMIIGTHNGNVHIASIPSFQLLRSYHARPSSVTAISVSPFSSVFATSPVPAIAPTVPSSNSQSTPTKESTQTSSASPSNSPRRPPVPVTPSNSIHIATALMDGYVCISSLVDPKDVTLRNYARPVHAVALSPNFKNDRTYLSGGTAGNLILTVGGRLGVTEDANTTGAAAAAAGWLSTIGLSAGSGKDTILHGGEGTVTSIKWSLSGKYVVWNNEYGTRVIRSHLHHQSADSEAVWKRLGHIARPQRRIWEDMAGVWKARVEWIDEKSFDHPSSAKTALISANTEKTLSPSNSVKSASSTPTKSKRRSTERVLLGWGDAVWVIHVHSERSASNQSQSIREWVENPKIIRFPDDVVSGLTMYTPSNLVVLIYRSEDESKRAVHSAENTPKKGARKRQNGLPPDLRMIDLDSSDGQELETESLIVSRYESLSASDYTLSRLLVPSIADTTPAQRGAFGALGDGIRDVGAKSTRLFSSSASVLSGSSSGDKVTVNSETKPGEAATGNHLSAAEAIPVLASPGVKIFIQSPFDCLVAIKRDETDRLSWFLERDMFEEAWSLVNDHPEVVTSSSQTDSRPSTPLKSGQSLADFFGDDTASQRTAGAGQAHKIAVEREKQRIGDHWIQQLVDANRWNEAGKVAGKVLGDSPKWSDWIMAFAQSGKFDEITPYIPNKPLRPPLPTFVYEIILGHYITHDKQRLQSLLDLWDSSLFDVQSIIAAIKENLGPDCTGREAVDGGFSSDGQRILLEILATLFIAENNPSEAIRCQLRIRNSDAVLDLIRDYQMIIAIDDVIFTFMRVQITPEQQQDSPRSDLDQLSAEPIRQLAEAASQGTISPETVLSQLEDELPSSRPYMFFYFRALWQGDLPETIKKNDATSVKTPALRRPRFGPSTVEIKTRWLVWPHADLVVSLFAEYSQPLLNEFLKAGQDYSLSHASEECKKHGHIPELVYLLSVTGQTSEALHLIIDKLDDVEMAISFAKEVDETTLWDDLIEYSMDKPKFICGLLEKASGNVDPVALFKRIPAGQIVPELKESLIKVLKEREATWSITKTASQVLSNEVGEVLKASRRERERGLVYDISRDPKNDAQEDTISNSNDEGKQPGRCSFCHTHFSAPSSAPYGNETQDHLVGFRCGHIYHLTCLLESLTTDFNKGKVDSLQRELAADMADDASSQEALGRVSVKMRHAQMIQSKMGQLYCPSCSEIASGAVGK